MASPAVTYTFSNLAVADANQVNQNFTDIINSLTDGSKSLSIDALTVAGNFTATGSTNTIGNAAGDDFILTASLASTIAIKTTATYGIGDATHGLTGIYFGANSQTVRIVPSGSMSATWTLTLPVTAGSASQYLQTNGSGVTSWVTLPDAAASTTGVVNQVAQTFGGRKSMGNSKCRVSRNADQTISATTHTVIAFDTEQYDTNGEFASSKFTATNAGYYQVYAQATVKANVFNADTAVQFWIRLNGTTAVAYSFINQVTSNAAQTFSAQTLVQMNGSTDYIEIMFYTTGSGNIYGDANYTFATFYELP